MPKANVNYADLRWAGQTTLIKDATSSVIKPSVRYGTLNNPTNALNDATATFSITPDIKYDQLIVLLKNPIEILNN